MTTADEDAFRINFGDGKTFNLDMIRARQSAFMPDGGHAWVIQTVFALEDPEEALDTMELNEENFVGVSPISCLLCQTEYNTENRFFKCPQTT